MCVIFGVVKRDIKERGRTIKNVLAQYNRHVKKAYDEFIKPTMKYADIIVPFLRKNLVALEFLEENVKSKLQKMGIAQSTDYPYSREDLITTTEASIPNILVCKNDISSLNKVLIKILSQEEKEFKE